MKQYSCILHYKGYAIIVENYIYKLDINRTKSFLTMKEIMNHIDRIETGFDDVIRKLKPEPNGKAN